MERILPLAHSRRPARIPYLNGPPHKIKREKQMCFSLTVRILYSFLPWRDTFNFHFGHSSRKKVFWFSKRKLVLVIVPANIQRTKPKVKGWRKIFWKFSAPRTLTLQIVCCYSFLRDLSRGILAVICFQIVFSSLMVLGHSTTDRHTGVL